MNHSDDGKNKDYNQAINALKSIKVEPSPFMKTRVLARAKESRQQKKKSFRWLYVFAGSMLSAVAALVVSFQVMKGPDSAPMELGKAYMVKADLRDVEGASFIKVELDGEVEFSSKKFAHIREMRSLTLSWDKLLGKQYLPVVVQGTKSGESHVRVHFYDKDNNIIKTQDFSFNFDKG